MKSLLALVLFVPLYAMASPNPNMMGWFSGHVLTSIIHGVIYGVIFKLFHTLGLVQTLVVGAAI